MRTSRILTSSIPRAGRRLIEDKNLAASHQGSGDLHHFLECYPTGVRETGVRINRNAKLLQGCLGALVQGIPIDDPEALRLHRQHHVLTDAQISNRRSFLVD